MNFLLPPPAPKSSIPDGFVANTSAVEFLQRIDALEEVTPIHPIWYKTHHDDKYTTLEELKDEIDSSQWSTPIKVDSKSGTLAALAKQYHFKRQERHVKVWNGSYDVKRIIQAMIGMYYLLTQMFRLPIIHLMMFHDEIFARTWWDWQSKVKRGLYYHKSNTFASKLLQNQDVIRVLDKAKETRPFGWISGDFETIFPILLHDNMTTKLPYIRRHVANEDGEAVGIDIAFPQRWNEKDGVWELYYDKSKPILVLHHGINGSSQVSHLQTHVQYYNARGHTCLALNVRGAGSTFVLNKFFYSGRHSDVELLIKIAHVGVGNNTIDDLITHTRTNNKVDKEPQMVSLKTCFKNDQTPMNIVDNAGLITTPITAVGFSLGGIILANYLTKKGKLSGLHSCVSVCAIGERLQNTQSERDWDPILVHEVKNFITKAGPVVYCEQFGSEYGDGISRHLNLENIKNASNLASLDKDFSAIIHGGSYEQFCQHISFAVNNKLDNLVTKLFIIHPENDPIVHVDSLYPCVQSLLSDDEQDSEFKAKSRMYYSKPINNLIIFIPRYGGHIASYQRINDKWESLSELSYAVNINTVKLMQTSE